MESKGKNQIIFLFIIFFSLSVQCCCGDNFGVKYEVHVGVILDMSSKEGKIIQSCTSMAVSDFYGPHVDYSTRVVLHTRDSRGQHLKAISAGKCFVLISVRL